MSAKSKDQRKLEKARERAERLKRRGNCVPVELRNQIQVLNQRVQRIRNGGRGRNG